MFKSQRTEGSKSTELRPDSYATSAVAVLPGIALPPAVLTTLQPEPPPAPVPAPPVPAPVPAPTVPVAAPVAVSAQAGPVVPLQPGPPAAWYPDPSGRYAHRWWDGTAWTEHTA